MAPAPTVLVPCTSARIPALTRSAGSPPRRPATAPSPGTRPPSLPDPRPRAAPGLPVPARACTPATRVIAPDAGVAANTSKTASVAGVSIGCANGKAVYFPFLVANGAEADYASTHFSAGDAINLSASVTTSG